MALPRLGSRFRVYTPSDKEKRPGTSVTQTRSKIPPRPKTHRQSVSLPALVPNVDSDTDYDTDSSHSDSSDHPVVKSGNKKPGIRRRVPMDNLLNARATRQLVINQQKLMFKYQSQEQELKELKEKSDLIKLELDRIRFMKTPEPEIPVRKRQTWWAADGGTTSPIPSLSRPVTPDSVHLGSTCLFKDDSSVSCSSVRDDVSTCSSVESSNFPPLAPSSCASPEDSDSSSVSGNSSFIYSDTEDEDRL